MFVDRSHSKINVFDYHMELVFFFKFYGHQESQ